VVPPQWAPSPHSLRLTYAAQPATGSDHDVYILDVATGVETAISSGPDDEVGPTWSPDGTRLVWLVGSRSYLRIASIAASNRVTVVPSDGMTTPLAWSPDGTEVYGPNPAQTLVLVVTVDGSSRPSRLTRRARDRGNAWPLTINRLESMRKFLFLAAASSGQYFPRRGRGRDTGRGYAISAQVVR
jgi:Tol biopolymer transport system component